MSGLGAGALLRTAWTLAMSDDKEESDNDAVESGSNDMSHLQPSATLTLPNGTTKTTSDLSAFSVTVDADGVDEVSSGLSTALEDAERTFQLSAEVPTKTVVCPHCGYANQIPKWNFTKLTFSGELAPLSGEYALGYQCVDCGYPP